MEEISVIVPFYNEQKYLENSVQRLLDESIFKSIILVNDCSDDDSLEVAKKLENKNKIISLISTKKNLGKGGAIKLGLNQVSTKYIIVHDADLEYFPNDINEMYKLALSNHNSLILGSRTIGKKERVNIYKRTFVVQKFYAKLFSILNSTKISDIASCYWLIKTNDLKELNIQENGFSIEVEVLSKSLQKSLKIIEVPIQYHARSYENGKKIKIKDGFLIFLKIIKYSKLYKVMNSKFKLFN